MKFASGMLVGGMLAVGATVVYNEMVCKKDTKKMIKKGKQFMRKLGIA